MGKVVVVGDVAAGKRRVRLCGSGARRVFSVSSVSLLVKGGKSKGARALGSVVGGSGGPASIAFSSTYAFSFSRAGGLGFPSCS